MAELPASHSALLQHGTVLTRYISLLAAVRSTSNSGTTGPFVRPAAAKGTLLLLFPETLDINNELRGVILANALARISMRGLLLLPATENEIFQFSVRSFLNLVLSEGWNTLLLCDCQRS